MKFIKAAMLGAVLAAGAVYAEDKVMPTDPAAIARQALMDSNGAAIGVLADMAGGKTAYDAAAAEAAKAALVANMGNIEATFMDQGAADPASAARPEIWANWDTFLAKATAGIDAAGALGVSSAESIGAGMEALGGSCKGCHSDFKMKKE